MLKLNKSTSTPKPASDSSAQTKAEQKRNLRREMGEMEGNSNFLSSRAHFFRVVWHVDWLFDAKPPISRNRQQTRRECSADTVVMVIVLWRYAPVCLWVLAAAISEKTEIIHFMPRAKRFICEQGWCRDGFMTNGWWASNCWLPAQSADIVAPRKFVYFFSLQPSHVRSRLCFSSSHPQTKPATDGF